MVGRIGTAHGLRGELKVEVFSDNPERFAPGSALEVSGEDGRYRSLEVESSRPHGKHLVVRFVGVGDRDAALELRNGVLQVERPEAAEAPEGEYYYYQLVGCRCHDLEAGDLGVVEDVIEDGGGVLLKVVGEEQELLIPFVEPYLVRVDIQQQQIELEVPPGLIEICGSR